MQVSKTLLAMSPDARQRFAKVRKKDIDAFFREGKRLSFRNYEKIAVSKEEVLAYCIKHEIFDPHSLLLYLKDHPTDFTYRQACYLFNGVVNLFKQVKCKKLIHLRGNWVRDEELVEEVRRSGIRNASVYNDSAKGRFPWHVELEKHFGSFQLFMAIVFSGDLAYHMDLYLKLSVEKGRPLNGKDCRTLSIEKRALENELGKENLKKIAWEKIRQVKAGVIELNKDNE
ncbi:MAG: hypothetical protein J6Y62_00505 [Clostridia bacterium]|nr:hypothetical protein [Clostridia bacterium]